jgi:uncharacterized protein (DUF433 family)
MDAAVLPVTSATKYLVLRWETRGTNPEPLPHTYIVPHSDDPIIIIVGAAERRVVTATEHPYIVRDPKIGQGEPIIRGTGIRVRTLVEYSRLGIPPQELLQHFPYLTLGQVFDALSYYQDHQEEMNTLINLNRPDNASNHHGP